MRGATSDEELARAAGRGDVAAFEALYERHHRALLSFSRHMLGRPHDAEDVVQHTFLAADRAFRAGKAPKAVRAWLYTVARNRCISLLRARREDAGLPPAGVPSTENLVADLEHREDLWALLADLRALPDDQRAALLLSELGDLTHAEVAKVIGVRTGKVKALVFQAREALLASAHARGLSCRSIREELATASGAALRRRHLKHHLAQCDACRAYAEDVRAQRAALAALLPVVPTVALREGVFAGLASGGPAAAAGAGAGIGAGILANSTAAKLLATVAIGGAAAGGGVAVSAGDKPVQERRVERQAERAPAAPAIAPAATASPVARTGERPAALPQARRESVRREQRRDAAIVPERERSEQPASAPAQTPASQEERGGGHGRDTAPGQLKEPKQPAANAAPQAQSKQPKTKNEKTPKAKTAPGPPEALPPTSQAPDQPPAKGKDKEPAPPESAGQNGAAAPRDPTDAAKEHITAAPGQAAKG